MATISVRQASRLGGYAKPYVAQILGSHVQYKFDRVFLDPESKVLGGTWTFEIAEEGLYEICDRNSKGAKRIHWAVFSAGVLQESISDEVVGEWLAALDDARAAKAAAKESSDPSTAARHARNADKIASDPLANAQAATELAAEKAAAKGVEKDSWLPYVRAALTFWTRLQERAIADDNSLASFQAAEQQLVFGREFQKLSGRAFDLARDSISYADLSAI